MHPFIGPSAVLAVFMVGQFLPAPRISAAEVGYRVEGKDSGVEEAVPQSPVVPLDRKVNVGGYDIRMDLAPRPVNVNENIRITVRVTPPQSKENSDDLLVVLRIRDEATGTVTNPSRPVKYNRLDQVFVTNATFAKDGEYTLHVGVWEVGFHPIAVGFLLNIPEEAAAGEGETSPGTEKLVTADPSRQTPELRDQVSFGITEAGLLRVNWLQKEPAPERVAFTLIDESGEELARQTDGADPFFGLFRNYKHTARVKVQVYYPNGVSADILMPFTASVVGK
ncbi:MAG: hypothetical protein AUJ92_18925 [Armatimonadetes bacterium CG2_30_59_28]|nr:MAG: hypothetical protein AUJ92_18925 [Armatimonadetes bacterium CG2_30_59_28]PIU66348.1 MAG: hypothetical protein COS85_05160 [Armatimonadetes bacterium CG07_land_8_20_14_0_80_59_28]PIX42656.1 MAG: hypothetical protein COZ56_08900 [Armatimonadetes bacterium CG_4_8_14_3_um_filter_58_9]PIY47060.1 MAG: hypothetical protein COZ05_05335 [Armatimonadetes bacterium CG_4_10_14_3_um_filter_59_10]